MTFCGQFVVVATEFQSGNSEPFDLSFGTKEITSID